MSEPSTAWLVISFVLRIATRFAVYALLASMAFLTIGLVLWFIIVLLALDSGWIEEESSFVDAFGMVVFSVCGFAALITALHFTIAGEYKGESHDD